MDSGTQFLVIGGSHGIGAGLVQRLVAKGGQVTVVSRSSAPTGAPGSVRHIKADVTEDLLDPADLPDVIHGLAYCPGTINLGPVRQLKADAMIADYQVNVVGAVKCLQAALPALKASGAASMVLFSTVAVSQGLPMHASVAAAKGAVEGLTRTLAAELAPKIRVNCIAPALTATPLSERFLSSEEKRAAMASKYPLKRVGEVDDIAAMAEYLLEPTSSWVTGQVFAVDGGMSTVRV